MWCARRDSNLRRFAGVSEREPAAEIPSGCARDLKPYGAPGEIRTPDLLLRRTYRTNNQQFSGICMGCDSLKNARFYAFHTTC
jgi:hypothetical protein